MIFFSIKLGLPRILFLLLLAGALPLASAFANEPSKSPEVESSETKPAIKKKRELGPLTAGLFYGTLISKDDIGFRISVMGLPPSAGRRVFYLDQATKYYGEKKKRISLKKFDPSTKVAVRFFAEGNLAVAKHLFLVEGEFVPKDYVIKPPTPKAPPKAAAKGGH